MTKRNRLAPMIAIACLAVGFGAAGAIGGTQIGSSSILKRGEDTLPQARHPEIASQSARGQSKRLPDHYPLVTPEGTIPVEALAAHGRFRGETASWDEAPDHVAIADTGDWQYSDAEIDRLETWQPQPSRRMETPRRIEAGVRIIRGNDIDEGIQKAGRAAMEAAIVDEMPEDRVAPAETDGALSMQAN